MARISGSSARSGMPTRSTVCCKAKEEQLEHALWSVISLFQHVEMLDELLLKHIDENGLATRTEGLAARLKQIRAQASRIRTMIEETASLDLDQKGDDPRADSP